jgi:hypothetical protein
MKKSTLSGVLSLWVSLFVGYVGEEWGGDVRGAHMSGWMGERSMPSIWWGVR